MKFVPFAKSSAVILLSELQYHPPVSFFVALLRADGLLLEAQEHYRKQTYRNRCLIKTAQGVQPLTVPVVDGSRSEKVKTSALEIDYGQNWIHRHWRTLQTAYGNSPYFEHYADYLHDIYQQKPALLFDLNLRFLRLLLRCFRLPLPLALTSEYHTHYPATLPAAQFPASLPAQLQGAPLLDRRDWLTPKKPEPDTLTLRPYPQVFGPRFEPGLSVLDLLFSQGPAASQYLL